MSDIDNQSSVYNKSQNHSQAGYARPNFRTAVQIDDLQLNSLKDENTLKLNDQRIRSKFPLGDKIKLSLNCFKPKVNGIELILK